MQRLFYSHVFVNKTHQDTRDQESSIYEIKKNFKKQRYFVRGPDR